MRIIFASIFFILLLALKGQTTQLNSGTTVNLSYLSAINKNVLIGGLTNCYLSKGYNHCDQLVNLSCPGSTINYNGFQRLDSNNIFMISNGTGSELYRSFDGGISWNNKWTNSYGCAGIAFFDTLEGITPNSYGNILHRTLDGGSTWTTSTLPIGASNAVTFIKALNDSVAVFGKDGEFYLSKNRGQNWSYGSSFGMAPVADFYLLNKDTIIGVSGPSQLMGNSFVTKTTNGTSWQNSPAPLYYNNGITYRRPNELYIVGADMQNTGGIVAKSTDFGQTWTKFNTGVICRLNNLAFVDDTIAILTGTGGTLLRWNYRTSVFTGVKALENDDNEILIYPNPCNDVLQVRFKLSLGHCSVSIFNAIGENKLEVKCSDTDIKIDLSAFTQGIYLLKIQNGNNFDSFKVIKE